jgi:hypothetical protein
MTADEKLAHSLKMQFGLAPGEPNWTQLNLIKTAINRIQQSGRQPTHNDWAEAVATACPSTGKYVYSGVDNSDLNTLLVLALQSAGGSR